MSQKVSPYNHDLGRNPILDWECRGVTHIQDGNVLPNLNPRDLLMDLNQVHHKCIHVVHPNSRNALANKKELSTLADLTSQCRIHCTSL